MTARKLYEHLSKAGYVGSYEFVNLIVREFRRSSEGKGKQVFIPLVFEPGRAFQFDWGEEEICLNGKIIRVKAARINYYRLKPVVIDTLNELASQLLNARAHNYEDKFMNSVKRFRLIVIDELGYVPIKHEARFLLFELFAKLYEQSSLIITTHLRFEEWGDIFGNAKATKAIIDRLTHHCQIIETGNKSFRGAIRCEDKGGKEVKKT